MQKLAMRFRVKEVQIIFVQQMQLQLNVQEKGGNMNKLKLMLHHDQRVRLEVMLR